MNLFVGAAVASRASMLTKDAMAALESQTPPVQGVDPDAELLELGERYERLLRKEAKLARPKSKLFAATEIKRYELMGVDPSDEEACRQACRLRWEEWMAAWDTAKAETGYREAWDAWNEALAQTRKAGRKILRQQARTLPGLLVKSRVIATNGEWLCKREPIEQLDREVRAFAQRHSA